MKRFRANYTNNHLAALLSVWRLINATSDAIATSQNMPARKNYWKRYLNDLSSDGLVVSKFVHSTSASGNGGRKIGEFYALSEKGAEIIAETLHMEPETVFFPHGGVQAKSPFQYPHRAALIKLLAAFIGHEKSTENEQFAIMDLLPEYRYVGANRNGTGHKITSVSINDNGTLKSVIPDAIVRFRAGEVVRVAAVELHRTTSTAEIVEQLRKHTLAIEQRCFSDMFNQIPANHVLSVYEDTAKLANVIEALRAGKIESFDRFAAGFHFAALDDVFSVGLKNAFFKINKQKSEIFI